MSFQCAFFKNLKLFDAIQYNTIQLLSDTITKVRVSLQSVQNPHNHEQKFGAFFSTTDENNGHGEYQKLSRCAYPIFGLKIGDTGCSESTFSAINQNPRRCHFQTLPTWGDNDCKTLPLHQQWQMLPARVGQLRIVWVFEKWRKYDILKLFSTLLYLF